MNFISKIYKKFLIAYKSIITIFNEEETLEEKSENNLSEKPLETASVIFKVINDDQIAVILNIPSISSEYDSDNMINDSENYANFLVHITNGLMYDQIISLVKKKLKETDDTTNKLFLENVLYFYTAIENDLEKTLINKLSSNKPLIRPINVFNVTPS